MGLNTYLTAVESYGYLSNSAGTANTKYITGKDNARLSIVAFGARVTGVVVTQLYFMQVLNQTTVTTAMTSNVTSVHLAATCTYSGNTIATSDYVALVLDDGTYQFNKVSNFISADKAKPKLSLALKDTAAVGNKFFFFGIHSDSGHLRYKLSTSAQSTETPNNIGIFFSNNKEDPMIVWHPNATSSAGSIDYISVGYFNK